MLQIIDLEKNDILSQISAEESANLLGGITSVNLANLQDGVGNFSSEASLFSIGGNKLFTIDLSRLTINLVLILPSGVPEIFRWTNEI